MGQLLRKQDFRPVTLKDRPLFQELYADYPPVHSDYLFTTMVSWQHYMKYNYCKVKDNIVIMTELKGKTRFRPPLGRRDPEVLRATIRLALKNEGKEPFGLIQGRDKGWIAKHYPSFVFTPHRDYFDYVYSAKDLSRLRGKSFQGIRNKINRFRRKYDHTVEEITVENVEEVKRFLRRWCLWKDCRQDEVLEAEKNAMLYSVDYFKDLGLEGLMIRIDGDIEAVTIFESVSSETAVIHYEKAIPGFEGIYKVINQEAASTLAGRYEYINRQSDMGIKGLRTAKRRYHPNHMVEVFHVTRESMENSL